MDVLTMNYIGVSIGIGTVVVCVLVLFFSLRYFKKRYAHDSEENERLLKDELELIEKNNEQLRKANEQAEEARRDALAADAAKGKFLAHMSHEIRTPINAVLGMDTMILRETKDPKIKEYALDIQNAGQTLLSLINDILDFSKIESGKLEIITVEYDFSSLIHDISNMLKAKAEAKKLELRIFVEETIPSKLLGDDVRIRQVLVNLLNNAIKYTSQGNVSLHVSGKVEGRKAVLDFSVEDTGSGIKEEDIEKLFEEFARIEEKRNRNVEGTGLGLSITTQLLSLMGSKLQVESTYGKGSKFSFTLEQQIIDSTPIGNLEERIREQSTDYMYASAFVAPDANVLVVDDNLMNLKVFVSLLKPTKVNVDVADSGKACLEMVREKHYDIIFLDHMMPEMDGVETLHNMQALEGNMCERVPVVALTANAITGAKEMYLAEGFDAFLPKPINPEKLEQMILKLLPRELLLFDFEEEDEDKTSDEEEMISKVPVTDCSLPIVDGVDWSYGLLHLPSEQLLKNTLHDFYKTLEVEAETLDAFYVQIAENADMLSQYRIKVHSMKSSANLIGATVLGGMAKILENAAANADVQVLDALHPIFITEWLGYREKLKICVAEFGEDTQEAQEKVQPDNYESVIQYLEALREAVAEFDIDTMDEMMKKVESFGYPESVQKAVERLSVYVTNMDCEQADAKITEIIGQLQ